MLFLASMATAGAQPLAGNTTPPAAVTLTLKDATVTEAARALSQALGVEAFATPGEFSAARISLQLTDVTPLAALDQVAAAFRGRWRPVYSVGTAVQHAPPAFSTGRRVTLHIRNASPLTVLTTLALADGGILGESPPSDERRITVDLDNVPVEAGMERVAADLSLAWTRRFEIIPGGAAMAPLSPLPVRPPNAMPGGAPAPQTGAKPQTLYSLTEPGGISIPEPGTRGNTAGLAQALSQGLVRVMQMDPRRRRGAIRQFARQMDRRLRELSALPPAERVSQRAQIDRVYRSGMRLYHGLTPDQQQEFRPLFEVLRRWLYP